MKEKIEERSFVTVIEPTFMSHRSFHDPAVTRSHSWWAISAVTPSRVATSWATSTSKPFHSPDLVSYQDCGLYFWSVATRMTPSAWMRASRSCSAAGLSDEVPVAPEPPPAGSGSSLHAAATRANTVSSSANERSFEVAHHASFRGEPERAPLLSVRNYMRVPLPEQSTPSVLDTSQEPVSDGSGVPGNTSRTGGRSARPGSVGRATRRSRPRGGHRAPWPRRRHGLPRRCSGRPGANAAVRSHARPPARHRPRP